MNILLSPVGTRGDFQPQLALALTLKQLGHDVLIASSPIFEEDAREAGISFYPLGLDMQDWMSEHGKFITRQPLRGIRAFNKALHDQIIVQFQELHALSKGFDLIVGAGLQFGAPSVAELLKIPYRYVAYAPAIISSSDYPAPLVPFMGLPRVINNLSWSLFSSFYNWLLLGLINEKRKEFGLAPEKDFWSMTVTKEPILAYDPELANIPDRLPENAIVTGSWHIPNPPLLDDQLTNFIQKGSSPVYFGFGSMTDLRANKTTKIVVEAVRSLGMRLILSRGWADYGAFARGNDLYVADSVSHEHLFPYMSIIIHHGGAGTTAAAARAGVPQIIIPHLADQFLWGANLQRRGLAPKPLPRWFLNKKSLMNLLNAVSKNSNYQKKAQETGALLRKHNGVLKAAKILEEIVENNVTSN